MLRYIIPALAAAVLISASGYGAAAVGAAAAGAAYYGYNNSGCYRDQYGQVICPQEY